MCHKMFHAALVLLLSAGFVSANLMSNPGFETALSGSDWYNSWGTAGAREEWNSPPEGTWAYYLKGTWSEGTDFGGIAQVVSAITPNQEYLLTADFYQDNGWSAGTQVMKLEFFNSSAVMLSAYTNELSGLPEATWAERDITATAPVGTDYAQIVFEGNGFGGAGVLGADNFNMDVVSVPEPGTVALLFLGVALCGRWIRRR